MTIDAFTQTPVTSLLRKWWLVMLLGVAIAVVGLILLLNLYTAAKTLALLVSLGLVFVGVDELAQAERHDRRWPSYVLGAIWLITAAIALVWPDVTLWALAVVVGIGFVVGGIAETVFALRYRRELPMWGLALLDGGFSIVLGILALVWPEATILALAILLGLRVLFRGCATILFGWSLRRIHQTTQRARA